MTLVEALNVALSQTSLRVRVERLIGMLGGHYPTYRFATATGNHVMVKTCDFGGTVRLRSVCRVRNKRASASLLINGQAGKNTAQMGYWNELEGPALPSYDSEA